MRVRKNAADLVGWDPILLWYAKAVAVMKARPITDPTSWRYQGAIHGYNPASDPFRTPGETLPPQAQRTKFWDRCQHGSWFFLPWHRAYLLYFEKTVAKAVSQLGGPADWALPYWNYTPSVAARTLPKAFRDRNLPDGAPNALFVQRRSPAANGGQPVGSAAAADTTSCLGKTRFINNGFVSQFGGPRTGFNHVGQVFGECESVPHNTMHGAIGGSGGWMNDPDLAALDPIFWLHHANIDRLWQVWLARPGRTNPTDAAWLTGLTFDFHDEAGNPTTIRAADVLNTAAPLLDYRYDPVATPAPAPPGPQTMEHAEPIPEMVGASPERLTLGPAAGHVQIALRPPTGPAAHASGAEAAGATRSVHLCLDNVTAASHPVESYEVYVNLPEGASPAAHSELMAGLLPAFGMVKASQPGSEHGGSGVSYSFDITRIARALQSRNQWNPATLRVSFVPHATEGDREEELQTAPVQVGRVSLYYA